MKKFLSAITLIFLFAMTVLSQNKASVQSLRAKYDKASKLDRPEEQKTILLELKRSALEQQLWWDYYFAMDKYVEVSARQNWKTRTANQEEMDREIENCGVAVVQFYHNRNAMTAGEILAFMDSHEQELRQGHNSEFYVHSYFSNFPPVASVLAQLIDNDYDYLLWTALCKESGPGSVAAVKATERFAGSYPMGALVELREILCKREEDGRRSLLEEYARLYSGKAAGLIAEEELAMLRFSELEKEECSDGGKYLKLKADCQDIRKRKAEAARSEKQLTGCITRAESLIKTLNSSDIRSFIKEEELFLLLRNLSKAKVSVSENGKQLISRILDNESKSYYVYDTLKLDLSGLQDGNYEIVSSQLKYKSQINYNRTHLSIASRREGGELWVYVADAMSGRPVEKCELRLFDDRDREIARTELEINGFTKVEEEFCKKLSTRKWGYGIQARTVGARGESLLSPKHILYPEYYYEDDSIEEEESVMLICDRSAFNPGERLQFKLIAYRQQERTLFPEGSKLIVELVDPEGKSLKSGSFTTGEFGSAAGEFLLEKELCTKGGLYALRVKSGSRTLTTKYIRIDEFTLPSFSVSWDAQTRPLLKGDRLRFSGKIESYSGHSLQGCRASYRISSYGESVSEGELRLDGSGAFEISFEGKDSDWIRYYKIELDVSDPSGESLRFANSLSVGSSIYQELEFVDCGKGSFSVYDDFLERYRTEDDDCPDKKGKTLSSDKLRLSATENGQTPGLFSRTDARLVARVLDGESELLRAESSDGNIILDISSLEKGKPYLLESVFSCIADNGKEYRHTRSELFLRTASILDASVESYFHELPSGLVETGCGRSELWVAAELFTRGTQRLEGGVFHIPAASVRTVGYPVEAFSLYGATSLELFFFKDEADFSYSRSIELPESADDAPELAFLRFLDTTAPGASYEFIISAPEGFECAASIFELASESMQPNPWSSIPAREESFSTPDYNSSEGSLSTGEAIVIGYGRAPGKRFRAKARAMGIVEDNVMMNAAPAGALFEMAEEIDTVDAASGSGESVAIRENFNSTITWEPMLRSDGQGRISLRFTNADKLSTYVVQLFAHDRSLRSATLRREMCVTLPVKVSIFEPRVLYSGDRYIAKAALYNNLDREVKGSVELKWYDGERSTRPLGRKKAAISIPAGGNSSWSCELELVKKLSAIENLGLELSFVPDDRSLAGDAVFVSVPVRPAVQTIREAHSMLLRDEALREALTRQLRSSFTAVDGRHASVRELSILDMLMEAIPEKIEAESDNLVDLSASLYSDWLLKSLPGRSDFGLDAAARDKLVDKIIACRNSDGGFAWFSGFNSSPAVTALLLERCAALRDGGSLPDRLESLLPAAVKYLDDCQFRDVAMPLWRGWLNGSQYLYVRSLYADVPLEIKNGDSKFVKQLRKAFSEYLVPSDDRGLQGDILTKARRLLTLEKLLASGDGLELASRLGLGSTAWNAAGLRRSMDLDLESLRQYAVAHADGGTYFPNAVMPWRGLLSSELYAHALLCKLFDTHGDAKDKDLAEGIRLWIMVQKQTQEWEGDFACLEALCCVLKGSDRTLGTRVLILEAEAQVPLDELKAASNGIRLELVWMRNGKPLADGDQLHVGDAISAEYRIFSEENRSFVRLTAPRNAALRPVEQKTGFDFLSFSHREVKADRSLYWFEVLPEEDRRFKEDFLVTQEGCFRSEVPTIECVYAPEYRANTAFTGVMEISE